MHGLLPRDDLGLQQLDGPRELLAKVQLLLVKHVGFSEVLIVEGLHEQALHVFGDMLKVSRPMSHCDRRTARIHDGGKST